MFDSFSIEYDCDDNGSQGKSICWHTSSCGDIGQEFLSISDFFAKKLYVPTLIYLEQEPDRCLINIYTLPDSYFEEKGIDVILGLVLLRNYYTIYDLTNN